MASVPQSYLPPASQPWGRAIETNIATVERDMRINTSNTDNALRGITANVNLLSQQQVDLTVAQEALDAQQDTLAAQQAVLVGTRPRFAGDDGTYKYGYTLNGSPNGVLLTDKILYANLTLPYTNIVVNTSALCNIVVHKTATPGFPVTSSYSIIMKWWYKNVTTGYVSPVTNLLESLGRSFTGPTSQSAYVSDRITVANNFWTTLWDPGYYEIHVEYYYYLNGDFGSVTLSKISNVGILSDASV